MKALTISQPHASLIADLKKFIENRSWPTSYRGPLAIHAGSGTQYMTAAQLTTYPHGCIIAVATLAACFNLAGIRGDAISLDLLKSGFSVDDILKHEYTEGPWCWVLTDVRKLETPVRCSGKQGLWEFDGAIG